MPKIVIIEDDLAIAQMYRLKFEDEGYTAEVADNGKLGLQMCEQVKPDIVLLDLMMPEMNGDEMLEKMRQTPWGKEIKVIIMTNIGKQEAPAELNNLNVLDYIVKADTTPHEITQKVNAELSKAGGPQIAAPAEPSLVAATPAATPVTPPTANTPPVEPPTETLTPRDNLNPEITPANSQAPSTPPEPNDAA